MNKNSMFFVGLDLGNKFSYITIVDQDGEVIEESRLPTQYFTPTFHGRICLLIFLLLFTYTAATRQVTYLPLL